jgi:flagellar motility protein MotE (MotC chaperone)
VKPIIIYAVVFMLAFILTSFGIIQLNSKFNNIFKFDFSSKTSLVNKEDNSNASDSTSDNADQEKPLTQNQEVKQETVAKDKVQPDSVSAVKNKTNKTTVDSVLKETDVSTNENNNISSNPVSNSTVNNLNVIPASQNKIKVDSSYITWEKTTAKVYESMDPKKAAKIIQNFSDNMARDIIYAMKKNKAADILAELDPVFAARITRMP